jgi:chorismate lyase
MNPDFRWPVVEPAAFWTADVKGDIPSIPWKTLAPPWQVLLLGDGSPTRQLALLSPSPTHMTLVDVVDVGDDLSAAPLAAGRVNGPRVRRRIYFENDAGSLLMYAVSWWSRDAYRRLMTAPALAIGVNITASRLELFREFVDVCTGVAPQLTRGAFGGEPRLWARSYLLFSEGAAVALIHEVFSPALQESLGAYSFQAPECDVDAVREGEESAVS